MSPPEIVPIPRQKYVYAIQIEGTPFVKIGNAVDPLGRATGLTTTYAAAWNAPGHAPGQCGVSDGLDL